jgi:hypothetical protein
MRYLAVEILLRLAKAGAAVLLGGVLYALATAGGSPGSPELALLCWSAAALFLLLLERSPI